jgi:hypothetical protein
MSMPTPTEGRATLAHSYRNLSEREILARLDGALPEAERVTAKAELLRRNAGDNGPDTTLATGFAPTSAFDLAAPEDGAEGVSAGKARARAWPWVLLVLAASAAALGWAIHARLIGV